MSKIPNIYGKVPDTTTLNSITTTSVPCNDYIVNTYNNYYIHDMITNIASLNAITTTNTTGYYDNNYYFSHNYYDILDTVPIDVVERYIREKKLKNIESEE
jgi:hypothetical protein